MKTTFERRTFHAEGGFEINGPFASLEAAKENADHNTEVTFDQTEGRDYTHITSDDDSCSIYYI